MPQHRFFYLTLTLSIFSLSGCEQGQAVHALADAEPTSDTLTQPEPQLTVPKPHT